ncbi:uncharacterized protein TrAtP1_008897 [Trichoderma atroviride]|uniref:uncharacterized protein n=1 Tax=Hypocrea atroviridis TaxID=63577 RepID=UPI003325E121|nr:hypothetical protein TrAtP1_008897 [Trichoderma atroviride]
MSLPQPHQTLPFRLHHPQQRPASFTEESHPRVDTPRDASDPVARATRRVTSRGSWTSS